MEPRTRWIAISLALGAASAFALGVNSAWWSIHNATIGPFGTRHGFSGAPVETGLSWIGGTDLWMRSSIATRAGGYIAMFVLVLLAGSLAAKRVPKLVARATLAA